MIDRIVVVSRHTVPEAIHYFIDKKIGIISIIDYPNDILLTDSFKIKENIQNIPYITLWFNDLNKNEYDKFSQDNKSIYRLFNVKLAENIINFVDKIKNQIDVLIVHCYAGVSRSGAVGFWANRYLELDEKMFMLRNPHIHPNSYIYNILYELSGLKAKRENDLKIVFASSNIDPKSLF